MAGIEQVIKKPVLTEKTSFLSEKNNRYAFIVDKRCNKYQVKNAVEQLFDVKVVNVKTNVLPGKIKRVGKQIKKTASYKKAYVQIEEGQKIEFFKGI